MKKIFGKLLFIACSLLIANIGYAELKMYFINVGQGDAEYLVLPAGKTVLIDGGPDKAGISEFVQAQHITHINYVVLTHAHADHYVGLNYVFSHCQVDTFYDTGMDNIRAKGDNRLREKAASKCPVIYPKEGDSLDWDPQVTVKVLLAHPDHGATSNNTKLNEASIVLQITYNGQSALFTGDIDTTIEEYLDAKYGDRLSAAVLKVAHHGSRYASSTEFLGYVKPKIAYIEVGDKKINPQTMRYGHPHWEALKRLRQIGAKIMRTDQNSTMEYTIQ